MGLTLRLLGSPEVILDGEPATGFVSDKARALLFYLAVEADRAQRRETLAGLLWPDYPERSARTNLSNTLSNLRTVLGDRGANLANGEARQPFLLVSRETIQFNARSDYWLDVRAFDERVEYALVKHAPVDGRQGQETMALYRGHFLEGFSLSDSPAFEQWALVLRERLQQQMGIALEGLGATYEELGDYARAQTIARRQLELEPWHEGAHRALMRALALSGERASALAQYEACAQTLKQELGAAPSPGTAALYEQIRDGRLTSEGAESRREARADLPRHNLPARITSFIGRERELSQLTAQITDPETRLVTVVGPGGMGKTRLALEAARRLLNGSPSSQAAQGWFPAGAWLVELSPVGDPEGVPLAVASALGARPQQGRELADILVDSLQTRELLLVLDNCEHLIASVARLVSLLISRCPQLTVLATSREALRIPGEQIVEVPPMAVSLPGTDPVLAQVDIEGALGSDAVQLFAARAAAVRPGFAADADNAADVVKLCRRLDGMPLAIELAAACLRALSLQDIAARLSDRFALLTRGSRVAEPRQQALENTVAWSYELLDRRERTLFDRLSVFRGGFTLRAAEGVCAGGGIPEGAVLNLLADLVDKSMVAMRGVRDGGGETRYELLETMRHYAAERLAERGEADAVSGRHARHYAAFAEQVDPQLHAWDDWVTPIRRLNAEVDNLAAAMRWSLGNEQPEIALRIGGALREWFWTHPYGEQFINWTRAALEAGTAVAPQVRAKALNTLAMWAWGERDVDLEQELAEEALRLARRAEDPKVLLRALYELSRAMAGTGQHERAAALFEQSRDISLECGHHIGAIEASTWLAFLQEPQEKRVRLEALLPQAPYTWQAYILQELSGTCRVLGDLAAAEHHLAQALQRWGKAEILPTQSIATCGLGMIAMLQGDDERAYSLLQQALDLGRRCGYVGRVVAATRLLGELAWCRGDLDTASQRLQEALALARERGISGDLLHVQRRLVYVACAQGDYGRAEEWGEASLEGYAEYEEWERGEAIVALARVALFRGEPARAVELYRASLPGLWPAEWISALRALEGLGWALAEDGQHDRATRLLAAVAREREHSGARLPPIDRPRQARVVAALRAALGEGAFAAAWAEGEALVADGVERVVTYALESPS
jgi:predicted ATPase/DNA-binding SARP family transcriptional activator